MPGPFFTRPNFEDRQIVQYSGSSITLSGSTNIHPTGNFRIYKNAFPGLVATSLDADGTVGWGPISGISWSISACTSPLYVNNLVSCPSSGGTIQIDAGNLALNSELNFLITLSAGTTADNVLVIDSSGYVKSIPQASITPIFTGGTGNCITDLYVTNIHGCSPINIQPLSPDDVYMVMGGGNVGIGYDNPLVKLHISGNSITSGELHAVSDLPITQFNIDTFTNQNRGVSVLFDYTGNTVSQIINFNPSGNSYVFIANGSNLPINEFLRMAVGGPDYLRDAIAPVVGFDFWRNKAEIMVGDGLGGISFDISPSGNNGRFWFMQNANAPMGIFGGGSPSDLRLGIALNPDGTEIPTASLQIGGTGTTGTFKYRDGNQASGYVLTSDSGGTATWQPFAGGTSASCITNLYVTNVLGCSPVNVNNSLTANDNNTVEIDFISGKTDNTNTIDLNNGTYSDIKLFSKGAFSRDRYLSLSDDYLTVGSTVLANGTDQYLALSTNSSSLYGQNINLISNYGQINSLSEGFNCELAGKVYGLKVNDGNSASLLLTTASLENGLLNGEIITGKQHPVLPTGQMRTGLGVFTSSAYTGSEFYTVFLSTPRSITYNDTSYSTIWNNVIAAGSDHSMYTGVTDSFIGGGSGNTISVGVKRSVILGGQDITATTSNTVYVPDLVIKKSANVPTTSGDTVGEIGSVTWDNNYFYVKTNNGWGRVSLDYGF